MRWGIGSYTFGWASGTYGSAFASADSTFLRVDDLVARARECGAPVLQIVLRPDILALTASERKSIRRTCETAGLELETGTVGTNPPHLREYLAASCQLGARTIRTIIRGENATLQRAADELAEVMDEYEREGVRLALENFEAFSSAELAKLIADLGSRNLGTCIDTVNNLGRGEGTDEVLKALSPSVFSLHLKDFVSVRSRADSGFEITGTPLGTGRLPVQHVVDTVLAAHADASVILEQWIPFQGSRENTIAAEEHWAATSIEALRKIAGHVPNA